MEGVGPLLIGYGLSPRLADRLYVAGGRLKAGCDEKYLDLRELTG